MGLGVSLLVLKMLEGSWEPETGPELNSREEPNSTTTLMSPEGGAAPREPGKGPRSADTLISVEPTSLPNYRTVTRSLRVVS